MPYVQYSQSHSSKNILPPINSEKYTYSLILDLDETLIHLEREYYTFNNIHNIKNKKLTLGPELINFLEKMKKIYEIILLMFSPNDYTMQLLIYYIKPFYVQCNNEKNTSQLLGDILNKVRYDAEITGDIRKSIIKEKYNIITEISFNLEE